MKKNQQRRSLSGHVSSMKKGVRYLDGSQKTAVRSQLSKVFAKIKLRLPAH